MRRRYRSRNRSHAASNLPRCSSATQSSTASLEGVQPDIAGEGWVSRLSSEDRDQLCDDLIAHRNRPLGLDDSIQLKPQPFIGRQEVQSQGCPRQPGIRRRRAGPAEIVKLLPLYHRLNPRPHFVRGEDIAAAGIDERRGSERPAPRDEFAFDNGAAPDPAAVPAPSMLVTLRQILAG